MKIIDNNTETLKEKAHLVFNSVDSFVLRASINRSDHCLYLRYAS